MVGLTKSNIEQLFARLNDKLTGLNVQGELYLVGGAVMCLVHNARLSTKDIDAYFLPSSTIRPLVEDIANECGLDKHWLNDAVKGFLSERGTFDTYAEYSHLTVLSAQPQYLLAMKCLAMRIGEEFHDIDDVRFLLRYLGIVRYDDATALLSQYYPIERFPQKTLYALEELLSE